MINHLKITHPLRLIDKAMTSALTLGAQIGQTTINADTMKAAIEDLSLI